MTEHLTIIDSETKAELASMGMEVRREPSICRRCEYVCKGYPDVCQARGGRHCGDVNRNGDCSVYERRRRPNLFRAGVLVMWALTLAAFMMLAVL